MKRETQRDLTHKRILTTATKLFLNRGYNLTSTRDIAVEIGITQPALYHHFADKEALFLEVMNDYGQQVRERLQQIASENDPALLTQFEKVTDLMLEMHPQSIYSIYLEARDQLSLSAQRKLDLAMTVNYLRPLAVFFERAGSQLRPDVRPQEAAEIYLSMMTPFYGTVHLLGGNAVSSAQRKTILLDVLINGMKQR
ncbi:TetR/AcrR family transcriptional regulator [Limosilactobacillus equigenerosi]|uniref:Transcriptional regulator n=1 Tax=Limosilactobacillus equigenerosi DSM 18793 = JCM 14505 TaxID=1423742 RepID=A0A0R1UX14_9LACO|nr:TetR/AcrR family transcriptional regulator [Limosilactobacillus equigenerosi]KRL96090.1 Transcriptional regulator [Limosilactobacillus equigenerosi DSM 18793 = JCM 14505]MCQ2569740.1 TetR/AcrR family transcriptional regulator [Limosilactobacillus sp.]